MDVVSSAATRVSLLLASLSLTGFTETEYERVLSSLPPELFHGGCHNPGHNPDTPEQKAIRDTLTDTYSWSIVTSDALDRVAAFTGGRGVVDFGAGNGYWAYLLTGRGENVVAIDNWAAGKPERLWHPVQTGSYELLAGTEGRVLLLSWPPRFTPMALRAAEAWEGSRLIYAGEILRGTADPPFHKELADNWRLVERISIPQWRNRSDAIFLFERRDGAGDGWGWMNAEIGKCSYDP